MKEIKINLNDPFEVTLAAVLTLPEKDEAVADALRTLYAAAHGRTVQTPIGPIAIVPATEPSLKDAALFIRTHRELIDLALRRAEPRTLLSKEGSDRKRRSALTEFISGRLGSPEYWPMPVDAARSEPNDIQHTFSRN
jgi:hypothetical protein